MAAKKPEPETKASNSAPEQGKKIALLQRQVEAIAEHFNLALPRE